MDKASILIIGCFDSKSEEFSFLYECLKNQNQPMITLNTGIWESQVSFPIDYDSVTVAEKSGTTLTEIRTRADRGYAVTKMGVGAATLVKELVDENRIKAVIGMGGGGGTFLALSAMQPVPLGIPKICLSTLAGKNLIRQTKGKDIILMPSIVDIAGLNSISKLLIRQAAAAIAAMADLEIAHEDSIAGKIAITMFGNTSACAGICSRLLEEKGYEIFVFHANGIGGQMMETLIGAGRFDAVLDLTTTELADELCGGICSAGSNRMEAATKAGIPQLIVPGCLDMVNFGPPDTVPEKYQHRKLYSWAPDVTLMRTNVEENKILAQTLVSKPAGSPAAVTVVIPLRGISQIDKEGAVFFEPESNQALFETIEQQVPGQFELVKADLHINDPAFAELLVDEMLKIIPKEKKIRNLESPAFRD